MSAEIYVAAAAGAVIRVIEADGYIVAPSFKNGVLDLGIVGKIIAGVVGVGLAIQTGVAGFNTPLMAFATGLIIPYAIERFVTKSPLGNPEITEVTDGTA